MAILKALAKKPKQFFTVLDITKKCGWQKNSYCYPALTTLFQHDLVERHEYAGRNRYRITNEGLEKLEN